MAVVTHGTALPDSAEKTDFYSLVDNASVTGILDADCASTMNLSGSKLATITTAGKVDGSAITNLANIPSGAGRVPVANGGIPTGGIIMWSGLISAIPSGWQLCDGTNGSPDLRDKFIVCTKAGSDPGAVSGNAYVMPHTHTQSAHRHSLNTNNTSPGTRIYLETEAASGAATTLYTFTDGGGDATVSTGTATAYALAYIYKT
jgi:hypothetical protein